MSVYTLTIPAAETGDDFHSGYYEITLGQTVRIQAGKQMTTWGMLILDGNLEIDGQFINE